MAGAWWELPRPMPRASPLPGPFFGSTTYYFRIRAQSNATYPYSFSGYQRVGFGDDACVPLPAELPDGYGDRRRDDQPELDRRDR